MRSSLPLVLSALSLIAVASCGDDDNPPGNDAGPGMDAGSDGSIPVDAGVPPADTSVALDAPAPTCANLGDVCTSLPCCGSNVCRDRGLTMLCEVALTDGGMCSAEGSPCFLGTACCPGTICAPGGGGLMCLVEGGLDASMMCGPIGAPCDTTICCPGLVCAMRGGSMFCLDRA